MRRAESSSPRNFVPFAFTAVPETNCPSNASPRAEASGASRSKSATIEDRERESGRES